MKVSRRSDLQMGDGVLPEGPFLALGGAMLFLLHHNINSLVISTIILLEPSSAITCESAKNQARVPFREIANEAPTTSTVRFK
jgi:hypothetical protein